MQQTTGEFPQQRLFSKAPPHNLANKAYALVPRRGDFASRLEQHYATITYLLVWLGDVQLVSFYAPPSAYCPGGFRLNGTLSECSDLPWIVNRFFIRGLDCNYRENWAICCALDSINGRTRYLDNHPDINEYPNDAQAPDPAAGPSA
jgi:hypothetical protein